MSEIKGQILGMLLVLMVFAVVGTAVYAAFKSSAANVSSQIDGENNLVSKAVNKQAAYPLTFSD